MKRTITGFLLASTVFCLSAAEMVWDSDKTFSSWKAKANVKISVADNMVKLTDIGRDHQILIPDLKLDPTLYNRVSITYRATSSPEEAGKRYSGQIFYAHRSNTMNGGMYWRIPPLKRDGEWHTVTLSDKWLTKPESWFKGGTVTALRLDITDGPGGTIDVRELKLYFEKATAEKLAQNVKRPAPVPVKPAVLDEGKWPEVVPEFKNFKVPPRQEPYFQGKMIKCPADKGARNLDAAHKVYYLRREFTLREKPVTAWVQFNADDDAIVWFNGQQVASNSNWREATSAEISTELKKGLNVWAIRYRNGYGAGGTMGEIYVEYADGSFERINTDENFVSTNKLYPDWNKPGKVAGVWEKVIALPGAPYPPWTVRLTYKDFSKPQKFVKAAASPAKASAGQKIKLTFTFEGKLPRLPFSSEIVLYRNQAKGWNETLLFTEKNVRKEGNNRWSLVFDYTLPLYFNTCDVTVRLESGALFCMGGGFPQTAVSIQRLKNVPGYEKAPVVTVKQLNGSPCFMLNGKPFYLVWGSVNDKSRPDRVPRHSGADLFAVTVNGDSNLWYPAIGKFDPVSFDLKAEKFRRESKDAWFIWDLSLYPPADWVEKYKSEMCTDDKGQINYDGRRNYSFSSEQARKDLKEAMEKAIRYLENAPYANRIIGYRVNGGHTIEWLGWDPKPGRTLDFSPAAQKAYKAFAAKRYPQLASPHVPSFKERTGTGEILWDQQKNLNVIAYYDFYSESVVDMVVPLCRAAKALVKNRKIIGTYYGYVVTLHASGFSQLRAHYALKKLLDSKCVDFLMSPQAYSVRRIGDTAADMKPFRTMQNNGIMPVIEDDTRTHNCEYLTQSGNYQTLTESQTIAVLRRNMGIALCRMLPSYYYALHPGTALDFPAMAREINTIRKVGEHTLTKARRQAEIAYVVSEETVKSMPGLTQAARTGEAMQIYLRDGKVKVVNTGSIVVAGESFSTNLTRLARLGAPADYLLAEDLYRTGKNYKLYIFINTFKYDDKFLKKIEELRNTPCTMLWVYAPGYTKGMVNSLANMKTLTGFDFEQAPRPILPWITLKGNSHIGTPSTPIAPMFSVKPAPDVTALGFYNDKTIALAKKPMGKSTSIFCGATQFTVPFLTRLAESAGVHIYQRNSDPMEANSHLLSLHTRFPGKKVITLPEKTTVLDVYNRKIVGRNIDKFEFDAPIHTSHLFYFGADAETLLKKLK